MELGGAVQRFDLSKTYYGDLVGTGVGVMLSAGDPHAGEAGYVALETVDGQLGGRAGSFAMQQFGTMSGDWQVLRYEIVPGSGDRGLAGLAGVLELKREDDGTHRFRLDYTL